MPGLSRRQFLTRAALLAAASGIPLETLVPKLALPAAAAADIPTTLAQTVLQGPVLQGKYRSLVTGPGEPYVPRYDIMGAVTSGDRSASRRSLLYLGHLSDVHVIDAQSPGRIEPMTVLGHPAAFHPQDPMSPHVTAAMVQSFSDLRYSPLTGAPMGAAVVTGDVADTHSHLELRWFIDLMDGLTIDPATGGKRFQGVQAWHEATWAYRPKDPKGGFFGDQGYPTLPDLLDQTIAATVPSVGLPAPWYAIYGNHDTLLLGTLPLMSQMRSIAIGGRKAFSPDATTANLAGGYAASTGLLQQALDAWAVSLGRPGFKSVAANPDRYVYPRAEFIEEHFDTQPTPGPVGHGFTERNRRTGETWWEADLSPHVRAFGLDSCNQVVGPDGAIPKKQFDWLERRLEQAQQEQKLAIVLTHHNSATLDNRAQSPEFTETLYGADRFIAMLLQHSCVVAWLNGHTHTNRIVGFGEQGKGFWEITTASCIDYPQQQQVVELVDNRDGTLSIFTTVVDHAAGVSPGTSGSLLDLASRSRELASNDRDFTSAARRGSLLDRNTELLLAAPFDLSTITDADLEAQHMTERARIAVHEQKLAAAS